MSVRTKNIVTWLWIVSLFTATVGVSGQQIYCYCMGKTTFSLFDTDGDCADVVKKAAQNCCAKTVANPAHACCDKEHAAKPVNGCTRKTTRVFQLKTEFTVQEKWTDDLPVFSVDPEPAILPFPFYQDVITAKKPAFQPFAKPPPPRSGRMICVRHGVFRC